MRKLWENFNFLQLSNGRWHVWWTRPRSFSFLLAEWQSSSRKSVQFHLITSNSKSCVITEINGLLWKPMFIGTIGETFCEWLRICDARKAMTMKRNHTHSQNSQMNKPQTTFGWRWKWIGTTEDVIMGRNTVCGERKCDPVTMAGKVKRMKKKCSQPLKLTMKTSQKILHQNTNLEFKSLQTSESQVQSAPKQQIWSSSS